MIFTSYVVDPTQWTIIKKARKESTKFLKVGGLYVRFDLANKEQEIIRMYLHRHIFVVVVVVNETRAV